MAGLVISGSSPVANIAGSNTPINTTASFTPPADSLFLAMWAGDSASATTPTTPTVSSSPAQTWTTDGYDARGSGSPVLPGQAAVFHAVVTGSPGSSTVTVTNSEATANDSILKVFVLTGHDTVTPIGAAQGGRQNSGTSLSDSYTASISGGQGFLVVCDWAAGDPAAWAPASGCTIVAKGTAPGLITYVVVQRTDPDGILGVPTTVGVTGLTAGGQYHWVIVEVVSHDAVIAAAGQAGYPAIGANAPMF